MKIFATASALVLAAAASTTAAIDCFKNADVITVALLPIIQPAYDCQTVTGFVIVPPATFPTPEQVTAVCAKCPELVLKGKDVKFPDCTVTIKGEDVAIEKLFSTILGQCGGASVSLAANSTDAANATAAPTTTVPAATTAAPTPVNETGSTAGSSTAEGKEDATVDTPAPTKAPVATTAAPKSAAGGVSATLSAAVAVAFSVAVLVL